MRRGFCAQLVACVLILAQCTQFGASVPLSSSPTVPFVAVSPISRPISIESESLVSTVTDFDTQDRPVRVTLPDNSVQTMSYAIQGGRNIVTTTDPLGNRHARITDARGNIVAIRRYNRTGTLLTSARYEYNAIGELLRAFDHDGNVLSIEYDLLGRRTAVQSADIGRREWHFNRYGLLERRSTSALRGRGGYIRYHYDAMHRLVRIQYPQSIDTTFEYGAPGALHGRANRIVRITDESGWIEYKYGLLGETIQETRGITRLNPSRPETVVRTFGYRSNYLGQMERIYFCDGEIVSYGYNRGGQVNSVIGERHNIEFVYVSDIGYDEFGQCVFIRYGNNTATWYTYCPERRWLTNLVTEGPHGRVLQNISYEFDRVGNVLGHENRADFHTTTQQFRYDDLYQLIEASGRSQGYVGSGLPVFTSSYRQTFTFNAIGSMLTKTSTSLHSTVHPTGDNLNYTLDYEYIPGTRMARRIGGMFYAYDADGNLIAEQAGSPPVTGVDASGRVIRYHEGVFSVDYGFALTNRPPIDAGEGNNVFRRDFMWNDRGLLRRSVDRQFDVQYRYGHDGQRALKYSVSGSQHRETLYFNRMFTITQMATRDIESKHIFVGNTRIVTKRRQAGHYHVGHEQRMQYFYHGDHLGSVQLVTDWEGNIYEHLEYTPYGELWVDHSVRSVGAYPTVFRFTAHERDPETGFTYAGARYLDPRTSRWISADPAMWEGDYFPRAGQGMQGLPNGGVFHVISLHVFNYANNNPVRYVDPDGRTPKVIPFVIGIGYVVTARGMETRGGSSTTRRTGYAMQHPINTFRVGEVRTGSNTRQTHERKRDEKPVK